MSGSFEDETGKDDENGNTDTNLVENEKPSTDGGETSSSEQIVYVEEEDEVEVKFFVVELFDKILSIF